MALATTIKKKFEPVWLEFHCSNLTFYLYLTFICFLVSFISDIFQLLFLVKLRLQDLSFFDHLTHDIDIDTYNTFKKWQYSQEMFFLLICKTVENAKAQNSRKLFSI